MVALMEEPVDFLECALALLIGLEVTAPYVCGSYKCVVVLTWMYLLLSCVSYWLLQWWNLLFT